MNKNYLIVTSILEGETTVVAWIGSNVLLGRWYPRSDMFRCSAHKSRLGAFPLPNWCAHLQDGIFQADRAVTL